MKKVKLIFVAFILVACFINKIQAQVQGAESYRPQFHFSPKKGWMNDPNGMIFLNGKYHLFFQHNPNATTWGPMHWGHAISTDLVNWQEQKIALYPDSLGTIFSGSAVIDKNNTAGFGKNALVAVFTHHDHKVEESKSGLPAQHQSLAYSMDEGKTWTKYSGNPVLRSPGLQAFRDPKVMWYEADKQWIMTLATGGSATFYASKDLKSWNKVGEFGVGFGSPEGTWECPDLFSLPVNGGQKWVLLSSLSSGAPNGGSGTQYFVGQFDGNTFTPDHKDVRWIDYGTDNYAGITWSNTGERKIFIGWMNNWTYANVIPEQGWRGAATIARDLNLKQVGNEFYLTSLPVKELNGMTGKTNVIKNIQVKGDYDLSAKIAAFNGKFQLELATVVDESFSLQLGNRKGEMLIIGYDKANNNFYMDRSKSGLVSIPNNFAKNIIAPRIAKGSPVSLKLLLDASSAELFADEGLTVMTNTFFNSEPFNQLYIKTNKPVTIQKLKYSGIKN
ncbi:glycoside hydrolase family 32 protein [Pedobacter nyackensis]|uniref:glycoside hydrolase family 32 protein n=1 Tax=Pedobacter nyackensis TaxID=475255 RepID=UPI00292E1A4C|nr:glycoside hydrolase family 32 protein [Pedobacter nyackensis]